MNIASGQVGLQNTCPDGQVEILEKYQKYCNIFNFKVLLGFKPKLDMLMFIWVSYFGVTCPDRQVEGDS